MQNLAAPALSREIITTFPLQPLELGMTIIQYSLLPWQSVHEISYITGPSHKDHIRITSIDYRRTFTEDRTRIAEILLAIIESFNSAKNVYIL